LSLQFTPAFSLRVLLVRAISSVSLLFFFTDPATTEIYTLSLHDALPIFAFAQTRTEHPRHVHITGLADGQLLAINRGNNAEAGVDRKSTRLNSSHVKISYAVFCLKKKKKKKQNKVVVNGANDGRVTRNCW